jgi:hypothetical protein
MSRVKRAKPRVFIQRSFIIFIQLYDRLSLSSNYSFTKLFLQAPNWFLTRSLDLSPPS